MQWNETGDDREDETQNLLARAKHVIEQTKHVACMYLRRMYDEHDEDIYGVQDIFSPTGTTLGGSLAFAEDAGVRNKNWDETSLPPLRYVELIRGSVNAESILELFVAEHRVISLAAKPGSLQDFYRCMTIWLMVVWKLGLVQHTKFVVENLVRMGQCLQSTGPANAGRARGVLRGMVLREVSLCRDLLQPCVGVVDYGAGWNEK